VSQNIVSREHSIFLLEDETHVVMGMSWTVHRSDSSTFNTKDLAVINRLLISTWGIFVYGLSEIGIESQEIRNTSSMVTVPMRQEDV
jgi:hypothetical protein